MRLTRDDSDKLAGIADYHERQRIKVPNLNLHAAIHAIVENQIAMGDATEAKSTLDRLMCEGLNRHEAVHAIGSVLAVHIHQILKTNSPADLESYTRGLKELTAQKWNGDGQHPPRGYK